MSRIISQTDNVIAADFRPKTGMDLQIKIQILYCDEAVCLARVTYFIDDIHVGTQHITAAMPA